MQGYISGGVLNSVIIVNIITILLVDYFSKLWSIGMVNSLKDHSSHIGVDFNKTLFALNIHKNLGFSIGFFLVFVSYNFINFSFIILGIALVTMIYSNTFLLKNKGATHA
jgi:hypothetical protein